jgi:peptidoglycan/xylan/chitin deacetylase (PgdA/CDA1 family)
MSLLFINNTGLASVSSVNRVLPPPVHKVPAPDIIALSEINPAHSICLTFDDGPDPLYTPKILDVLADHQAKATFFVLGKAAEQFPHLVEQILQAGHSIGNHTYSHRHPWVMSSEQAKQEVVQTNLVINTIAGITPRWFRPPFGRLRTAMRVQAHSEQMTTVLWSRSIIDWGFCGTKVGIARRLDQIKSGDIVLMHDGRPGHNHPDITYQCLPGFLRALADKCLVARNLDEVIYRAD